jgi:ribokinase
MPKIVVIGALVFDMIFEIPHWIEPNQAVHASHVTLSAGGKGLNQAVSASRLGADVSLVGYVGDDMFGNEMLSILSGEGVNIDYVTKHESARTSIASIIVKDNIPGFIGAPDASKKINEDDIRHALESLTSDDILLVDFEIPQPMVQLALQIGRDTGATTVLNPAPYFTTDSFVMKYLHLADILIPNTLEAQLLTESKSNDLGELAKQLMAFGVKQVVMTNGEEGSVFFDGQNVIEQKIYEIAVVDTTGASDAYVGAYCVGLAQGWSTEKMLEFASAAAALACTVHGTMPSMPTLNVVNDLIEKKRK